MLPLQGAQVQSLVGELKSHMLCGMAKKKREREEDKEKKLIKNNCVAQDSSWMSKGCGKMLSVSGGRWHEQESLHKSGGFMIWKQHKLMREILDYLWIPGPFVQSEPCT